MKLDLNDPASIAYLEFWRRAAIPDYANGTLTWAAYAGNGTKRAESVWSTKFSGKPVGCVDKLGYCGVTVTLPGGARRKFYRHRVLFALAHGYWPDEVDHIDRNRANDALTNLRAATRSQNECNKPKTKGSGYSRVKGVSWCIKSSKWVAQITINRKHINLGRFTSESEAASAYAEAAGRLHGEFACISI